MSAPGTSFSPASAWSDRERPWADPTTRKLLLFNFAVTLLTAFRSETFFHPDEHYQIIEFVGLKLGFTRPEELTWEFVERARPFMQPALYYALLKPLVALGLDDRFVMIFLMRLASCLVSFAALVSLMQTSAPWVSHEDANRSRIRWLTLAGFIPYIAVRATSENLSTACLLLALSVIVRGRPAEAAWSEGARLSAGRAFGAGLLLGMCFEFRFQMAFAIVGLLAWMWLVARDVRATLVVCAGGLVPMALALAVDSWGYGEFAFPPWNYLRTNMIEGVAAQYGTKWFFGYLHITLANIFAPVVILAIVGLTVCWVRRPKHVLSWTTIPFIFAHSAIGHKEERYMFPVFLLALVGAAMGFEESDTKSSHWLQSKAESVAALFRRFQRSWLYGALVVWNLMGMALLAFYPLGWRPHYQFAHWAQDLPAPIHFAVDDETLVPSYPFFRKHPWNVHVLEPGERADAIDSDGAPVYWLRREPFTSFDHAALGVSDELVYTEFPGASFEFLRKHLWPSLGAWRTGMVAKGFQSKRATWISVYPVERAPPKPDSPATP
ncbi:MAG: hypothetical protein QM778_36125 [Myxococcales bacterium]